MSNVELTSIRPYPIGRHPLARQDYLVSSDPISLAWQYLDKALRRRSGGLVFWGMFRAGKSKMIEYLMREAQIRYPKLPCSLMAAEGRNLISEKEFFAEMCRAIGISSEGTAGECKRRSIERLVKQGMNNDKHLYVLFVDEPQKWTDIQLTWLCEVYDKLEFCNVRLVTVLVGQRELVTFRRQYIQRGDGVIITRLMNTAIEFCGLQSLGEVAYVLEGYDTLVDTDQNWPFTRFFFPQAYASGFRMEQCAEVVWQAFNHAFNTDGRFPSCQIPMKYLTAVVELLFMEYHQMDDPTFGVDSALMDGLLSEVCFPLYLEMANPALHISLRV